MTKPLIILAQIALIILGVGGAAAGIMTHIFNSQMHSYSIEAGRQQFQGIIGNVGGNDWQAGVAFASYRRFREMWNGSEILRRVLPRFSNYIPRPRRHNVDPFNARQGFYGTYWSSQEPLILAGHQVAGLAVPPPPPEGSPEYERDLAEVAVIGALESRGSKHFPARTPEQTGRRRPPARSSNPPGSRPACFRASIPSRCPPPGHA